MHYGKTVQPVPFRQCAKCKTIHCCHTQSNPLTVCFIAISFTTDNRSTVRTTTNIVKHLIQTSMKKNLSSQSMDATLQDFLGNKPSMETLKPDTHSLPTQRNSRKRQARLYWNRLVKLCRNKWMKLRRWYAASAASNAVLHWRSTRNLFSPFRPLKTASLCSLAAARATPLTASSACWASGG